MTLPANIHLASPLPGVPGLDSFSLAELDDAAGVYTLISDGENPTRFFLIAPQAFFADYDPSLSAEVQAKVGANGEDAAILAIVHPRDDTHGTPTVNLLAPLVVNVSTGEAVQTILDGEWPLRAPLIAA